MAYVVLLAMVVAALTVLGTDTSKAAELSLYIGAPMPDSSPLWGTFATQFRINVDLWMDEIDAIGGISIHGGNDTVRPVLFMPDIGGPSVPAMKGLTKAAVENMLNTSTPPCIVITPYSTALSVPTLLALHNHDEGVLGLVPVSSSTSLFRCSESLAAPCTRKNSRRFVNAFGTFGAAYNYFAAMLAILDASGAKKFALVVEDIAFVSEAIFGCKDMIENMNLELVAEKHVPEAMLDDEVFDDIVQTLVDTQPDAVLIASYAPVCQKTVQTMKAANFLPKAVGYILCGSGLDSDYGYFLQAKQWDPRLRGKRFTEDENSPVQMFKVSADDHSNTSSRLYDRAFKARYDGVSPSFHASSFMEMLHLIHRSVVYADSIDFEDLRDEMVNAQEYTFFGEVSFDRFGMNSGKEQITTQNYADSSDSHIVSPITSSTAKLIYPLPHWRERTFEPVYWVTTTEVVVLWLTIIGLIVNVGLFVGVIYTRESTVMKASSPSLIIISLTGTFLLLLTNLVWTPRVASDFECFVRPLLLSFGFTLLFAPLFAKTYRLYRLFNGDVHAKKRIKRDEIWIFVGVPCAVDALFIFIWYIVSMPVSITDINVVYPSRSLQRCSTQPGFEWACVIWKFVFLLTGAVFIFRGRKVPGKFNETKSITTSMYNVIFGCMALLPISASDRFGTEVKFILRSAGLIRAALGSQVVLLMPRFTLIFDKGFNVQDNDCSASNGDTGFSAGSSAQSQKWLVEAGLIASKVDITSTSKPSTTASVAVPSALTSVVADDDVPARPS